MVIDKYMYLMQSNPLGGPATFTSEYISSTFSSVYMKLKATNDLHSNNFKIYKRNTTVVL